MLLPLATTLSLLGLSLAAPIAPAQLAFNVPTVASGLPLLSTLAIPPQHYDQLLEHIASLPEKRLVQLAHDSTPIEITEGEKALLLIAGKRFVDVTDEQQFVSVSSKEPFPEKLSYTASHLSPIFDLIDTSYMKKFLTKFSSFRTRYYRSQTGKGLSERRLSAQESLAHAYLAAESQQFLLATLRDIAKTNKHINVTFTEFEHPWGQNSIIARFEPLPSATSEAVVILGGHQDSTNIFPFLPAPGADDDGSGSTTLVMAFKALVNSTFAPSLAATEFHWYSAEEGGLLGSQAVAQSYAAAGKKVRAMLQMDMTAWVKAGTTPTVGIITDFVDPDFTELIRKVVGEYAEIGYTDTKCGYACSDHASWSKIGAPSAFSIESSFEDSNHNIHSSSDTITYSPEFSFDHMAQFSRITIALAVELGGGASLGLE
ncbi:bacterial leucyl aminopeptidase, partial [Phenoliferia sp. Uapishka_3]